MQKKLCSGINYIVCPVIGICNSVGQIIVIYGISGLFKILPTRGICNLRGLARVEST
jgi:hypothetical protein